MAKMKERILGAACSAAMLAAMITMPAAAAEKNWVAGNLGGDCYVVNQNTDSDSVKGYFAQQVYDATAPDGDNWVMKIIYPGQRADGKYIQLTQYNSLDDVAVGTKVRMKLKYKVDSAGNTGAVVFRANAEQNSVTADIPADITDGWKEFSYDFDYAGYDNSTFFIEDNITISFDDIQFGTLDDENNFNVLKTNSSTFWPINTSTPAAVSGVGATVTSEGNAVISFTPPTETGVEIYKYNIYEVVDGEYILKTTADYDASSAVISGYRTDKSYRFAVSSLGQNLMESARETADYGAVVAETDPNEYTATDNWLAEEPTSGCYTVCQVSNDTVKGYLLQPTYDTTAPDGDDWTTRVIFPGRYEANKFLQLGYYHDLKKKLSEGDSVRVSFKYRINNKNAAEKAIAFFPYQDDSSIIVNVPTKVEAGWNTFTYDYTYKDIEYSKIIVKDYVDVSFDDVKFGTVADDGTFNVLRTFPSNDWWRLNKDAPEAVTAPSAAANDDGTVTVSYTLPESSSIDIYKIKIYQSVGGAWRHVKSVNYNETTATFTPAEGGSNNFAIATVGRNMKETLAMTSIESEDIINLAASASADTVTLTWNYGKDASEYKAVDIYKSAKGISKKIATVLPEQTKFLNDVESGEYEFQLVPIMADGSKGGASSIVAATTGLVIKGRNDAMGNDAYYGESGRKSYQSAFYNQVYEDATENWSARYEAEEGVTLKFRQHGIKANAGSTYKMSFKYNIYKTSDNAEFYVEPVNGRGIKVDIDTAVTSGYKTFTYEYTSNEGDDDHCWFTFSGISVIFDDVTVEDITNGTTVRTQGFGTWGAQSDGVHPSVEVPNVTNLDAEVDTIGNVILTWNLPGNEVTNIAAINIYELNLDGSVNRLLKTVKGNNSSAVLTGLAGGSYDFAVETLNENEVKSAEMESYFGAEVPETLTLSFDSNTITAGKLGASVTISNGAYIDADAFLAVALYNKGRLVDISTITPDISDGTAFPAKFSASVNVPEIKTDDKYTAKAFLWNGTEMKPLRNSISLGE